MTTRSRVLLERTMPFTADPSGSGGDGLSMSGHAAVFGQKTRINSWEGTFDESIRAGAFAKTFHETTPVIQFDHGRHPMVGSIPIGAFEDGFPTEDETGAVVKARLVDNWLIQPVRDAIANGSVHGMSFRFQVIRDAWTDKNGKELSPVEVDNLLWNPGSRGPLQRELVELKVPELGPVVFPAYSATDVSVRSIDVASVIRDDPDLVHEVRRMLAIGSRETVSDKSWGTWTQADYDIDQWKRACLVDTGEGDAAVKGRYKVPVREPDGTLNRNGCHAAAGGHGIPAVQGISDAIRTAAAKKLVGLYQNQLKEDPPEAIMMMAGMGKKSDDVDLVSIARALLFDIQRPPGDDPEGNPVREGEPVAEPPTGHPADPVKDAPPAEGHPSQTDSDRRRQIARRNYVTLHGVGKKY